MDTKKMKTQIKPIGPYYAVEAYTTVNGEVFERWHTLRMFKNQGDARLFHELCDQCKIDPRPYLFDGNKRQVVTVFKMHNGRPKLTISPL